MNKMLFAALGLILATPAVAQPPEPAAAVVDPERLKVSRALIDQILPPATRQQMMQAMIAPMMTNIRQSMTQNPQFAKAIGGDPRIKRLFDEFMDRQISRSTANLRTGLPGMTNAMARAYARRFNVQQLQEISAFFATPTGQLYTRESMAIMSDPDIAAWQRDLMTQSMGDVQADIAAFVKRIADLKPETKK